MGIHEDIFDLKKKEKTRSTSVVPPVERDAVYLIKNKKLITKNVDRNIYKLGNLVENEMVSKP
jgi:hypothetical protein